MATLQEILARNYTFVATADHEDGGWVITFPDLPGCITQADTFEEVGEMTKDAYQTWVTAQYEEGFPIPEPSDRTVDEWDWQTVAVDSEVPRFTVANVASQLGVSVPRVYQLAKTREVGTKQGGTILFSLADVKAMKPRKPGRPKGSTVEARERIGVS